jgi:anti-sigma regulatory factor (Ser/Thr protein kinase)
MDNVVKLNYKIDGKDFSFAGEASGNFKRTLKQLGIKPETTRRAAIAMYEAEMNIAIHAYRGEVNIEITPERIKIVLEDEGPGISDIDLAMKEGYSTATDKIREMGFGAGMGLPNIKKYTDKLDVTSEVGKGTKLEIIVLIK